MDLDENKNMDQFSEKPKSEITSHQSLSKINTAKVRKTIFIIIGIALVLLLGLWIWKSIEINNLKKSSEKEKIALEEQASSQIVQSNEVHLKLLAKPIVWALRSEMMRSNLNQVNLYLNDLIKEKNFQSIAVANDKGTIVASTNKKEEGTPFSSISKESYLSSNETNLENVGDSVLIMASPIMGFNNRLGTLYIKYSLQQPVFN